MTNMRHSDERPFVLPGTSGPACCAICGCALVADENRETGWRCPGEAHAVDTQAVEALQRYGTHVMGCAAMRPGRSDPCDCGFDTALACALGGVSDAGSQA